MSVFKNLNVVNFYVTNWEQAKKFYSDVLEWPSAFVDDTVGWAEWGLENQAHFAVQRWPGPGPAPAVEGGATPTFTVDNAQEVTKRLRGKGVKCDDVQVIPGMITIGTFYDPEGHRLTFVESAPPPK
jgi:catechol 2,3-dioxygenase-like lactoylglutathione lyase family enzyme